MAIFKRAWRLKIEVENAIKTFQEVDYADHNLKIQFEITNQISSSWAQGNISLWGLNKDDMLYLSSSARITYGGSQSERVYKHNLIQLEAGYVGDIGLIGAGNITQVSADFTNPDNCIKMSFGALLTANLDNVGKAISLKGEIDQKQIAEEISKLAKIKLKWDNDIKPAIMKGYSVIGTPFQMIEDFRKQFKNELVVYFSDDGETLIVESADKKAVNKDILSEDTGMLGVPTPTQYGIAVNSLLNNKFKAGNFIELKSKKLSNYNGTYIINTLKHRGSNQANEWISNLELRKVK